jgi:hypothetical protein
MLFLMEGVVFGKSCKLVFDEKQGKLMETLRAKSLIGNVKGMLKDGNQKNLLEMLKTVFTRPKKVPSFNLNLMYPKLTLKLTYKTPNQYPITLIQLVSTSVTQKRFYFCRQLLNKSLIDALELSNDITQIILIFLSHVPFKKLPGAAKHKVPIAYFCFIRYLIKFLG